jgi:hypothetical protein
MVRYESEQIKEKKMLQYHEMYQHAKTGEEISVYLENQPSYLGDLMSLVNLKIKDVKVVKNVTTDSKDNPLGITMIDLKLNVFGPVEDEVYATHPVLVKNIRRGNTILRLNTPEGTKFSFGRKGLEKFFDMRWEFISPEDRMHDAPFNKHSAMLHMEKNMILAGPLKAILEGSEVEVCKTLKANGENVQVSWNSDAEAWVVCSKNVALVAKRPQDLARYTDSRFGFAREMASVWFTQL